MRLAACAALVIVLAAGCGGESRAPRPSLVEGGRVFASSCSGCHTLKPVPGRVTAGGPLAGYRFTTAQLESFVRTMPVPRPLTERELKAVVAFVADAQRREAARTK